MEALIVVLLCLSPVVFMFWSMHFGLKNNMGPEDFFSWLFRKRRDIQAHEWMAYREELNTDKYTIKQVDDKRKEELKKMAQEDSGG